MLMPVLRWKYVEVPLGLHHPVWVEDPFFDAGYHFRRIACPAPGDNRALCDLIAQLYILPLDRNRPLWMVWMVEGLQGGKFANVLMLHHAYADGAGVLVMMKRVFQTQPFCFDARLRPPSPEPVPTRLQLLLQAGRELPGTLARSAYRVVRGVVHARALKRRFAAEGKQIPPNPFHDVRDSPVNDMLSACRSFAFETFELARVKRISKALQVTVNDLFVACAAAMYRRLMIDKGYAPDSGPLVTAIPFTQRPAEELDDGIGNMTTTDYLMMPVHLADPLARLAAARASSNLMKEHFREAKGSDVNSVLDLMPAFAIRAIARHIARTHGKFALTGNALISNVAGPTQTLYLGEIKLDNWISTGQVTHGMVVNTTAWSYDDKFNVSILADKKVVPDGWPLLKCFREALDEYGDLAEPKHPVVKRRDQERLNEPILRSV
jgi:WS/DGAT/MGAT family acyltransferase